jgi:hypothetical protein
MLIASEFKFVKTMEVFPGRILFKKRRRREHEFLEE